MIAGARQAAVAAAQEDRARYAAVRGFTEGLCAGLGPDDCQLQSMPEASPLKWHLAHTTWFFETFVLGELPGYRPRDPAWAELFNSYYHSVGAQHPRPQRALLSRPSLDEVRAYRARVDEALLALLEDPSRAAPLAERIELGLQHEQQHQELMLTDLKHALSLNPLRPAYRPRAAESPRTAAALRWLALPEGPAQIGAGDDGFAFDNERPRHTVWLHGGRLASRPVVNGEYLEFIRDGGYATPTLWLSDGWDRVRTEGWQRPLYWDEDLGSQFTLAGLQPLDPAEPVCHLSFYEAEAFARWAGLRLPREDEWEWLAAQQPLDGHFVDSGRLHPAPLHDPAPRFYGDVWCWTASPYGAYPRYQVPRGALGEYNAKFMCGQMVLRGGSCASAREHLRPSYRNFFAPHARWQFSGLRLARDDA